MRPASAFLYNFSLALRTRFALLCFRTRPAAVRVEFALCSQFSVYHRARQGAGTAIADRGCHESGKNNKAKAKTFSPLWACLCVCVFFVFLSVRGLSDRAG